MDEGGVRRPVMDQLGAISKPSQSVFLSYLFCLSNKHQQPLLTPHDIYFLFCFVQHTVFPHTVAVNLPEFTKLQRAPGCHCHVLRVIAVSINVARVHILANPIVLKTKFCYYQLCYSNEECQSNN